MNQLEKHSLNRHLLIIVNKLTASYNCVRPHQSLGGKTPAQAARMNAPSNWKGLIEEATKHEATLLVNATKQKEEEQELKVINK